MPWTSKDVEKHNKAIKTDKFKKMWVTIANSSLSDCLKNGGKQSECEGKAIRIANAMTKKAMAKETEVIRPEPKGVDDGGEELAERLTQKRGSKEYWAEDFLVVEDAEKPSTWSLPVKYHGKPDHGLMGNAYAALTHPHGFRGKKYEGPNKAEALRKLKALYKSEGQPLPSMKELEEWGYAEPLIEYYDEQPETAIRPYHGAISFADIHAAQSAQQAASEVHNLTFQFQDIIFNILEREDVTDKVGAIRNAADEFVKLVDLEMGDAGSTAPAEMGEWDFEDAFAESAEEEFTESQQGQRVRLIEDGGSAGTRDPLTLEIEIINPGWGNHKDNHYYPASVLRRDAKVFEGVKMYTSDHNESDISEKTEVAKIQSITGFSKIGAPIGRVVVFDPDFAEKTRNRAKAGELSSLECSILAVGKVRPGFTLDGRKGALVEAIERALRVDWVTRAGAGGRALRISESEADMKKEKPKGDEEELEEKVLTEENGDPEKDAGTEGDAGTPAAAAETSEPVLSEADVDAYLQETRLPAEIAEWVKEGEYKDLVTLKAAVEKARTRLAAVTKAGQVFGQGSDGAGQEVSSAEKLKERSEKMDEIDRRFGLRL